MRILGLATCVLLAGALPAAAANVDFSGTVTASCSIVASTNGTLALDLATGDTLGSDETGGVAGSVTILSIGNSTLTVGAPTRTSSAPVGYVTANEVVEVSYAGASGLSAVTQAYTTSQTSRPLGTIAASVLTINNRITNTSGFPAATYTTRTVVTCAQP
ncbi:MAG: hypothetical protein JWQ89_3587 [Devosia sp.]|uniref:hypothetical protein n=1 Tax=Devosia sp. TaxID=1871048 RepID=UPI00260F742E|nr:hypothetical protein [Devosia sp.]MDB5541860.1 hypothetical protein [Devosia sp.]